MLVRFARFLEGPTGDGFLEAITGGGEYQCRCEESSRGDIMLISDYQETKNCLSQKIYTMTSCCDTRATRKAATSLPE